ncbi:hypothetical protein Vi05172_g2850 [Venturia inaequalis]|nr:hypothetical protein Vi05172_g2850 [Venturia inaequalis]
MQFTTQLIAAFIAFVTIAEAAIGCGKGYCPCVEAPHSNWSCHS